jgi:hypothetical protein
VATEKVKYFEKRHLQVINREAAKQNYNRQLNDRFLNRLPEDFRYPIVMTLVHEHAQGKPVDAHMRCFFSAFNVTPELIAIDVPMSFYDILPEVEIEMPDRGGRQK